MVTHLVRAHSARPAFAGDDGERLSAHLDRRGIISEYELP
jgi:hypothetical protein